MLNRARMGYVPRWLRTGMWCSPAGGLRARFPRRPQYVRRWARRVVLRPPVTGFSTTGMVGKVLVSDEKGSVAA